MPFHDHVWIMCYGDNCTLEWYSWLHLKHHKVSVYSSLCVLFLKLWITKDTQISPLMFLAKLFTPFWMRLCVFGYLDHELQNHLQHLLLLSLFLRTFGHQIFNMHLLTINDTILCVPRNDSCWRRLAPVQPLVLLPTVASLRCCSLFLKSVPHTYVNFLFLNYGDLSWSPSRKEYSRSIRSSESSLVTYEAPRHSEAS